MQIKTVIKIPLYILGFVIYYSPFRRILQEWSKNEVKILNFHYVGEKEISEIKNLNIFHKTKIVKKQIEYLQRNYSLVDFETIDDSNNVILTFDDGYLNEDIYSYLSNAKIPFYIFLIAGAFEESFLMWRNKLNMTNDPRRFDPVFSFSMEDVHNINERNIQQNNSIYINSKISEFRGAKYGSHSYFHFPMSKMNDNDMAKDIQDSVEIIKEKSLDVADIFSIPFGIMPKNIEKFCECLSKNKIRYVLLASNTYLKQQNYGIIFYDRISLSNTSLKFVLFTELEIIPAILTKIKNAK